MNSKKWFVYGSIIIMSIFLVMLGVSYAYWQVTKTQPEQNLITTECFRLYFEEQENQNIQLLEAYPISDEDGKRLVPYTFTIRNECPAKARYTIRLEVDQRSTMNTKYIKSMLNTGSIKKVGELKEVTPSLSSASKSYLLEEMTILGGESKSYELRLWIDGGVQSDNKEVMNKIFESKVTIEGEYDPTYTEAILNGTDPVLAEGLIPVTISDSGVVKKADTSTEWYKYENKKWANAVILEDERILYQNGDTIPESNIESYFVWIPRYRYQIFDNGLYDGLSSNSYEEKSQEIKVVFENRETQLSKGTKKGDWLTHPAFTSFDSNGMWVGKFETGYKGATTIEAAQSNTYDVTKIEIKPNVYSWRGIQVSNAHLNSYNYKRDMDSHMMKNTEWGAVAYLQHSKYGSMSSVRINNNTAFITGYSAVSEPTCGYTGVNEDCNKYESIAPHADGTYTLNYFNSGSTVSSTTGNYSGIYDMSGGAHEYVMAVVADKFGIPMSGRNDLYNGGFNGIHGCPTCNTARGNDSSITSLTSGIDFPDAKYYDLYAYGINQEDYPRGILGDATSEMGPFFAKIYGTQNRKISSWYSNVGWLNSTEDPWLRRGYYADYGTDSGIFQFNGSSGEAGSGVTYRIVLTPGGNL